MKKKEKLNVKKLKKMNYECDRIIETNGAANVSRHYKKS